MLFHTWPFLVFFVIVYAVYLPLRHTRWYTLWLLAASYVFYGYWNPLFLVLIVWATTVDFFVVRMMAAGKSKKPLLAISIVNNLAMLSFFKYGRFATENVNALLGQFGLGHQLPLPDWLLPVGISFFTFQSMSYTIDYYRGQVHAERSFIRYAAFVSLFPQLVAGPIERARNLLPQLHGTPKVRLTDVSTGASLFLVGMFKKMALADWIAQYVDPIYEKPEMFPSWALALATFGFAWQIYFDFSGYTDMARGIAKTMGINLMLNFKNPYLAASLGEFWGRWHISLSTWFKEYVYIPLGGNRGSRLLGFIGNRNLQQSIGTYLNMAMTMVISGFWHGAAWTFIVWGALHALGRIFTRELERTHVYKNVVPRFVKQVGIFLFVLLTWVYFRADSIEKANYIVGRLFDPSTWSIASLYDKNEIVPKVVEVGSTMPVGMLFLIVAVWVYQYLYESRIGGVFEKPVVKVALAAAMILYLLLVPTISEQAFIYFQF